MARLKYTKEILEEALFVCETKQEFYNYLGIKKSGSSMTNIRRRLLQYGLDINLLKNKTTEGAHCPFKKDPASYLRLYNNGWECHSVRLRNGLLHIGRAYRCELCGLQDFWNGGQLKLHVDHIDGDRKNSLQENLRFLCPNCHSQTETYGKLKKLS